MDKQKDGIPESVDSITLQTDKLSNIVTRSVIDVMEQKGSLRKSKSVSELRSPTEEELKSLPLKELHGIWRKNHRILASRLKQIQPPFFGLHGTSEGRFQNIEASGQGNFEMATFYEKEYESKMFLYKLYAAVEYCRGYTRKDKTNGRILLFNVEVEKRNVTSKWEYLKGRGSMNFILNGDSKGEKIGLKHLIDIKNLFWRTSIFLPPETYSEKYLANINLQEEKFDKYARNTDENDFVDCIIKSRLLAQEIVAEILNIFDDRTLGNK